MQDNQAFRALFTLPPIQESAGTSLAVPETPAPKNETGDREVDAVLWLQECVRTGHPVLIEQALAAAKKIKTPMKDLDRRYMDYLMRRHGDPMRAAFGSMGFGELENQAKKAIERKRKQHIALSRFGSINNLFKDTPAEAACKKALRGVKRSQKHCWQQYDEAQADARFAKHAELAPLTLADCMHAMQFGNTLYELRNASDDNAGEHLHEFQEHHDYCFRSMAYIKPRSKDEALAVLEYLEDDDATNRAESPAIIRNLIAGGWA